MPTCSFKALLEDKQLQIDAVTAGDKAGQTLGGRMSKGIGLAMKVGLGVISGAAGIATAGLIALDDITAQYAADTGASAEEAKAAGKAINDMSGRNLQPMREIGRALAKVHTDMGLTGTAAEATAEQFLKFARVTKRDAAEEVKSFDDILDAWGLTADKSRGLMDQLIASQQQYGGSIAEDEAALKALAPAMKALNFNIDDTLGLFNLFKTKGLDAEATQRAFNSAVKKLPPGTNLKDILDKIRAIEDPAKRAAEAIAVFGSRGGVALANALAPGSASLDDFKISAASVVGATDKARDAIDSTFGNRIQLAIAGVTAKIREFGSSFGPGLTGLASLATLTASLSSALGLDRLIAGSFSKVAGSALVKSAVAGAGRSIGATFLGATIIAEKFGSIVAAGFDALPGSSVVKGAAIKAGAALGGIMSGSSGLAMKLGFVGILAVVAEDVHKASLGIAKQLHDALGLPTIDLHPEQWPWPLGPKGAPDWAGGSAEARAGAEAIANSTADGLATFPGKVADDLIAGAPIVANGAATGITDPITGAVANAKTEATAIARATPREIANALRDAQFHVDDAVTAIKDSIKNTLSKTKEIAQLQGFLTGDALANALHDKRPEVRAEAEAWKTAAEERLFALRNNVPAFALATGQNYADALAQKKAAIGGAAATAVAAARGQFIGLKADAYGYGTGIGQSLAAGLRSKLGAFAYAAALYGGKLAALLRLRSPAQEGPLSKGGGPEGWARRGAELYTAGWATVVPGLERVFANLPRPDMSLSIPGYASAGVTAVAATASVGAVPASGGFVINGGIHVDASGQPNPTATGAAVKQGIADTMADVFRDQSTRGVIGLRP